MNAMNRSILQSLFGPRVPESEIARPGLYRWRYVIPTLLFVFAAAILLASFTQPYWNMTLHAPQYPKGLNVHAYLNRLGGDVQEVDNLNHYIGMRPLEEAAQLERSLSLMMTIVMATLLMAAVFVHSKWAAVLALPALLFPAGFLIDLHLWLDHFGQNLDPTAALSSSVKPFTPPVLGEGLVGNFKTVARADVGLIMATIASGFVLAGLYFHRRAYKPLVDRARQTRHATLRASSCRVAPPSNHLLTTLHLSIALTTLAGATASVSAQFDLQAAIDSAEDGITILVPPGTYQGTILINRSIALDGQGKAIIDGGGTSDVVRIAAPQVAFRGFVIRNSGNSLDRESSGIVATGANITIENNVLEDVLFGITMKSAPNSIIRQNHIGGKALHIARRGDGIRLWDSHDSVIEGNVVFRSRDVVMWYSDRVLLKGNRITESRYGLHFMYSHENIIEDNILEDNSVGAFLMYSRNLVVRRNVFARNRGPSGYGLGVKDMQGMIVEDNVLVGNCVGIYLDNPPVYLPTPDRFTRNVLAYNDLGIAFQPSVRRTEVFENSFIENHQQVAVWGGGELRDNHFTVNGRGNYWSDYRGFDLTGDGLGDWPYEAESLWDNLMDREPSLRLFLFSPAQQAVELAAKAFPVVKPRSLLRDDAPLMQPVRIALITETPQNRGAMWAVATGLFMVAGLMLLGMKGVRA